MNFGEKLKTTRKEHGSAKRITIGVFLMLMSSVFL